MGDDKTAGINSKKLLHYANEIKKIHDIGVQISIVIGGGNIYRGFNNTEHKIDRVQGDYMGMLATLINGLALQNTLENIGIPIFSSVFCRASPFINVASIPI